VTSSTAAPVEPADLSLALTTAAYVVRAAGYAVVATGQDDLASDPQRAHAHTSAATFGSRMSAVKCGAIARRHVANVPRASGQWDAPAMRAHTEEVTVTRGKRDVSNCATFRFDSRFLRLSARETEHACTQIFRRKSNNEVQ